MKVTNKIYHILTGRLRNRERGKNEKFVAGYKAALLDSIVTETGLINGKIKYEHNPLNK